MDRLPCFLVAEASGILCGVSPHPKAQALKTGIALGHQRVHTLLCRVRDLDWRENQRNGIFSRLPFLFKITRGHSQTRDGRKSKGFQSFLHQHR